MPKRETIEPHPGDKRYVRRNQAGGFTADQANIGRSLARDRRHRAAHTARKGEGDKGDREPS